ncbi:MAG: hypothetical protein IPL61_21765 [Myxococcales bacterium]|nr:hypothetical protein [Myxococcales bacterium]
MRSSRSVVVVGVAALVAAVACTGDDGGRAIERGGWDRNSGSYSGNLGSFSTITGLRGSPPWGPTGPGTLNNATIYGIQYDGAVPPLCATATAGVTSVNFLSSSGTAAAAIGPDVEVARTGGQRARLAMGEEIQFPGHVYDGYLGVADVVFRLRRVDTMVFRQALWYAWPIFELSSCDNAGPVGVFAHHGFVTWAPMVRLPELPGDPFEVRTDMVQAITTVPRDEYRDNPNVPQSVALQTGALWFKFAFYASLPVALHGEPALDFVSASGAAITNAQFLWRGALALGNASWVQHPAAVDPDQHSFLSFFTRDGTPVAMFALARGLGAASSVRLPPSWGGAVIAPLELTAPERANPGSLDSVQAQVAPLPPGDRMAAASTHLGSGPSPYRAGLYAGNSLNNNRYHNYSSWKANGAAMAITGLGVGRIASQLALESALGQTTDVDWLVACESPLANGMLPFEMPGNWLPPPPDAPVVPPPTDAGVDGPVLDAGIDGGPDAPLPPDAGADATPPDAPLPSDAGADATPPDAPLPSDAGADAIPPDAPTPPDAGIDATPPDAPTPPDAGIDAAPPDAPTPPDAGADAMLDDAAGEGAPGDASCASLCADAA